MPAGSVCPHPEKCNIILSLFSPPGQLCCQTGQSLFCWSVPTGHSPEPAVHLFLNLPFVWWRCGREACDHFLLPPIMHCVSSVECRGVQGRRLIFPVIQYFVGKWLSVTGDCKSVGGTVLSMKSIYSLESPDMNKRLSFLSCFQGWEHAIPIWAVGLAWFRLTTLKTPWNSLFTWFKCCSYCTC